MLEHPRFVVVDDFLDEPTWTAVWTAFQFDELHPVSRTSGAWKLDDGVPLGGAEVTRSRRELDALAGSVRASEDGAAAIEAVLAAVVAQRDAWTRLVGDGWQHLSARAYVYPRDTALSWHVDDHALYAGAFVYYAHPQWNAHWGGELLIAELDESTDELPIMGYRFDTEPFAERLAEPGYGHFVQPRPNRLVVLGAAPHAIARISPAAGQHVRASVAGFFLRQLPSAEGEARA